MRKVQKFSLADDKLIMSKDIDEVVKLIGRDKKAIQCRKWYIKKNNLVKTKKQIKSVTNERISATGMMNFKVNGTELSIEKGVKQVLVTKNSIEINL